MLDAQFQEKSFALTSPGPTFEVSGMKVNLFGVYTFLISLLSSLPYYLGLTLTKAYLESLPEEERDNYRLYDDVGKAWSKGFLAATFSYPEVVNRSNLSGISGSCLIVANHASWLDIPALCTVLDHPFKFIAKGSLTKVPLIGQQLTGGKHILIDREDRRSQLKTFKEATSYLKSGTSIMAFPEGGRSENGRLGTFKGGVFSMAMRAGVPVLPITVCNAGDVMPTGYAFPVQGGGGKLRIVVHGIVEVEGRKEDEVMKEVRERIISALPRGQMPEEEE